MDITRYSDLFGMDLSEVDPETDQIIQFEEERQTRRFILIPSESIAPRAVRQALGSVFNNVYAEGYPSLRMTRDEEALVLDAAHQLVHYRRYADRRFYKGVEYADVVECLAQRRAAQCFATAQVPAERIHVNVQALSGAAANLAVYQTFLKPGDTLMGMNLYQGGHLTHGSEFNLSGRLYGVVSYNVDRVTGRLDYEAIRVAAQEHRPKVIVAGYTSYPWAPDWSEFRKIADEVGALLLADISHTAGMATCGAYPTPVGWADVITFTTHKTICGPRGAVIMTTDDDKAKLIDAAVFPGQQGGPHVNKFAAMAVAFKVAQSEPFRSMQHAIVANARSFGESLTKYGLKLAHGGTDTHLLLVDLRAIKSKTGFPLRGEMAARILDLCGIVVNKNTIPGDDITALGSGIRMGTPWVTQRGMGPVELDELAAIIAQVVTNIQPFKYTGLTGELPRGKIDLSILEGARRAADVLAARTLAEKKAQGLGYPHYSIVPEVPVATKPLGLPALDPRVATQSSALLLDTSDQSVLRVSGWRAKPFLQQVCTSNVAALGHNQALRTLMLDRQGKLLDDVMVARQTPDAYGRDVYLLVVNAANAIQVKSWLRGLADGYVLFDDEDIFRKVEGPAVVEDLGANDMAEIAHRLVSLAVAGPDGPALVERLIGVSLPEGALVLGSVQDIALHVVRLGYGVGDIRVELLVSPDEAEHLWSVLMEAGGVPRGTDLQFSLRERAGLPNYAVERPIASELYQGAQALWFDLKKPYFVGQAALKQFLPEATAEEFTWSPPANGTDLRTPLFEEHRKLNGKMVPFAGWEMPVWYTSVSEEHKAVRTAAGLFDVAHMGVLEVSGEHAASFLDVVASNYARWIDPGQSAYTYLLDPDGHVIDDFIMYRRAWDQYLLVVNAANADKDLAWLQAVNSRRVVLDRDNPGVEIEGTVTIRNLKDPSSGRDQRADLALQGPQSLAILQSLSDDPATRRRLAAMRRTDHDQLTLSGIDLIILRTGYTGEEWGYELLVHPDRAVELWNLLLAKGAPMGLKPCGLAARDSTRIEAGLPLHGHELAGDYGIGPAGAGFAPYVKFHKPFFVGRQAAVETDSKRKMEVIRFRVAEKGVRALRSGDPVVNRRGQYIGRVTSCTLVGGNQIGMAYVERRYNEVGTEIGIFPLGHGEESPARLMRELSGGDKVALPVWAVVMKRMPDPLEKASWGQRLE